MPVQVPSAAVSVEPSTRVPEIVGSAVFCGASAFTAATGEVPVAEPAALVPVTSTRMPWPASSLVSVYSSSVAPAIGSQFVPSRSQRSHW